MRTEDGLKIDARQSVSRRGFLGWLGGLITAMAAVQARLVHAGIFSHGQFFKGRPKLWVWGVNSVGQLGLGNIANRTSPTPMGASLQWVDVFAGKSHSLAKKANGTLWSWGENTDGELGIGSTLDRSAPTLIGSTTDWKDVSAGSFHTLAVRNDGTVWAWGMNTNEQHGTGDGGTVGSRSLPVQVSGVGQSCTSVSAGNTHSFALASDGTLWVWGYGTNGQLGLGVDISTRSTPVLMAGRTWSRTLASNGYSAGIDSAGSLWAWGTNTAGRLGIQEPVEATNISSPVQVGIETGWTEIAGGLNFVAGIRNGALWAWGNNDYGQLGNGQSTLKRVPTVFPGGPFLGISAGSDESFFIRPDGTLWGSGANLQYQLGQSDSLKRLSPCQIGSMTSVAWVVSSSSTHSMVIEDGNLWTWGGNGTALGHNDTLARSSPQQLGSATDWQRCAAGGGHSLAIRSKTLWSWGGNGFGQIGDSTNVGKSSPVQIGALTDWVSVSAGAYHSLAIREATPDTGIGTLWSFGLNGSGQLGISNLTSMNSPVQIGAGVSWSKVAAGLSHSLALRVDGSLWAWGLNSSGQLGLSDLTQRTSPVQVGVEWAKVAAGSSHALALKTNGTLWSWGANGSGQLGLGIFDTAGRSSPVQIGTDTNWVEISCGRIHSMAMKNDGSVWLWGDHTNGRLGFGPLSFSSPVQVGTDTNWAKVQAGEAFTIAQKLDGTLWSWGYNLSGQLGHHSGTCFSSPVQIGTEKWEKFSCRGNHVLALKK